MSKTILIVDDSSSVLKFVAFGLRNSGFRVLTASDGMDAIEKMSQTEEKIDMIVTDLNMPNMDGYELIATLRQNPSYRETPVIILSSEEGEADIKRGLEVGANSYLIKPFKSEVMINEVKKYITA